MLGRFDWYAAGLFHCDTSPLSIGSIINVPRTKARLAESKQEVAATWLKSRYSAYYVYTLRR